MTFVNSKEINSAEALPVLLGHSQTTQKLSVIKRKVFAMAPVFSRHTTQISVKDKVLGCDPSGVVSKAVSGHVSICRCDLETAGEVVTGENQMIFTK